eukprot:gene33631-43265_t
MGAVFEAALQAGIRTPEEHLTLFLTQCDALRRQASPAPLEAHAASPPAPLAILEVRGLAGSTRSEPPRVLVFNEALKQAGEERPIEAATMDQLRSTFQRAHDFLAPYAKEF